MLGYNNLLNRPSIELNTIWETIIKKARWKKNLNMSTVKKIIHNSSNPSQVYKTQKSTLNCPGGHSVTVIGASFPKPLRRQSSGGCRFNPDCRRVTIQEYLTLVPGYG